VNGRRAELGERLSGGERVLVDGRPLRRLATRTEHSFLAYYKPAGEVSTRADPDGRRTIFEQIRPPRRGRWISVGRLDIATSGLLLLATDGELAHRLMHPRYGIEREYAVRLLGRPDATQLERLEQGVELEDGVAALERFVLVGGEGRNVWYRATLREGRNREIRRLFEAVRLPISRLLRVRYGPVELGRLRRGQSRPLTAEEVAALYEAVGMKVA
jgi:23S rRNA pseudouridine2605 synthase